MSTYFPSGNHKLSNFSFWEYCYTIFGTQYVTLLKTKGCFVDDRETRKDVFSVLNLTIICIKPFTCSNNLFSLLFKMKYYFPTCSLNASLTAFKTWQHWLTQQAFMSDIPSQKHPSPISLWQNILTVILFLYTFESSD